MVPKHGGVNFTRIDCFRAVLFRMVPKPDNDRGFHGSGFRAVLFRMVPKQELVHDAEVACFRAVLFRMVPKKATHFLSSF